jgi:hypothetical protein
VSGDLGGWSARRTLKPKVLKIFNRVFYERTGNPNKIQNTNPAI